MSSIYRSCSPRRLVAPALLACSLLAVVVYDRLLVGPLAGQVPGLVEAGVGQIVDATRRPFEDVAKALLELEKAGLVEVDLDNHVIRLPGVAEDAQRLTSSPNVVVGWASVMREMPDCPVRARHAEVLRGMVEERHQHLFAGMAKGFETLSKGFPNPSRTPSNKDRDQDTDPDQDQTDTPRADPAAPAARAAGSVSGQALELVPAEPERAPATRSRRRANPDDTEIIQAIDAFTAHRRSLGLVAAVVPLASQATLVKGGIRAAGTLEQFLLVLSRAAEHQRRQAERAGETRIVQGEVHISWRLDGGKTFTSDAAQYFKLTTLCRPTNVLRYLEQPELDHREPQRSSSAPARASPSRPRGPAPPQNDEDPRPERRP